MSIEELHELLIVQSNITTIILGITAVILLGVLFDLLVTLYKAYIKKGEENDKNI